jgi:hypothetical protein
MRHLTGFTPADMEGCAVRRAARRLFGGARVGHALSLCFLSACLLARALTPLPTCRGARQVYEKSIVHPDDRARLEKHLRSFAGRRDTICALEPIRLRRLRKNGTWARLEVVGVADVRGCRCGSARARAWLHAHAPKP